MTGRGRELKKKQSRMKRTFSILLDSKNGRGRRWQKRQVVIIVEKNLIVQGKCTSTAQIFIFFSFVADTPPPAYMPPEDQMGQDTSQSMDTSNSIIPQIMPNISSRGEINLLIFWNFLIICQLQSEGRR